MPVVMKGGTSGNRESGLPPANPGFNKQVPEDTSNNSGLGGVNLSPIKENRHLPDQKPPVPEGGSPNDGAV